jgi:arsenate reductase
MKYVLAACTHNAGRSQMLAAFLERHAPDDIRAESAGHDPAPAIWPNVLDAMREVGIDLSDRRPKKLELEMQLHADWAITLACGDSCPYVPGVVEEWDVPDPAGLSLEEVGRSATRSSGVSSTWSKTGSTLSEPTAAHTTGGCRSCCHRLWPSSTGVTLPSRSEPAPTLY